MGEIDKIYLMKDHYLFGEVLNFMLEAEKKALDMTSTEAEILGLQYQDALDRRDSAFLSFYGSLERFENDKTYSSYEHPVLQDRRIGVISQRVEGVFSKETRDRVARHDLWDEDSHLGSPFRGSTFVQVYQFLQHVKYADSVCKRTWISVAATCRIWVRKGREGLPELLNIPADVVDHLAGITNHQFYEEY